MKPAIPRALYWAPRILGILFALFLSLFAFDVFEGAASIWDALLGLLIHLIPVYIVIIVLVLAWRWEWIGAVGFLALGPLYPLLARGASAGSIISPIVAPLLLLGALFLAAWLYEMRMSKG